MVVDFFSPGVNTSPDVSTFGSNIRKYREVAGLQAKELAEKLGVQPSVLSAWENDRKGLPETPTLLKLAKALSVGVEQLLEGVDADYETLRKARLAGALARLPALYDKARDSILPAVESGQLPKEVALAIVGQMQKDLDTLEAAATRATDEYVDVSDYKQDDLPVIAEGEASPKGSVFWSKDGTLLESVDNRLSRPYDVRDPKAFGVQVRGDSMLPVFKPGMYLVVSPNTPVSDGDEVYVELTSGEHLVKIARRADGGWILESANPAHEPRFVKQEEIEMIHPIVWARRAKKGEAAHGPNGKRRKYTARPVEPR